ncbi:MAG: hypothetical protein JTT11_05500 [Candidatus Brockarchaeota archaeon]|nr:hypothetical protein [Candidatus Brockarchaeota archaeon]
MALMGTFASMYAVLGLIPAFKILGGQGFISASAFVSPVVGFLLGPALGASSMVIGGILGTMLNPAAPLGMFSFVPGAVCALCSGFASRGKAWVGALILGILVAAFLAYPANNVQPIYPYYVWLHVVAAFVLASPLRRNSAELARKARIDEAITGMALMFFPSTMAEQMAGSLIWAFLLGPAVSSVWAEFGMAVMLAYPIERAIITLGSSVIGAASSRAMRSAGLEIGR